MLWILTDAHVMSNTAFNTSDEHKKPRGRENISNSGHFTFTEIKQPTTL